jgi:hypothetical protein
MTNSSYKRVVNLVGFTVDYYENMKWKKVDNEKMEELFNELFNELIK